MTESTAPPAALGRLRAKITATVRARLVRLLDLDAVRRRLDQAEGSLTLLSNAHHDTRQSLDTALQRAIEDGDASARALREVRDAMAEQHDTFERARLELARVADAVGPLVRLSEIHTTMAWIALVDHPETLLVSVVMPTHNRSEHLPRSIGSVLAQRYPRWELLVVDDGSTDDTAEVLATFDDPRIRRFTADHRGCSGARNVALEHVTGDVVVYLDDDNVMHPDWLTSVVWAFGQRPDVDVLYGARIIDDRGRVSDSFEGGLLPFIQFEAFDREALREHNLADIGTIAHRSGLPDLTFDEQLVMYGDWDLFLRLTADKDPLQLPVIAIGYATDAPNRISDDQDEREVDLVRAKLPPR